MNRWISQKAANLLISRRREAAVGVMSSFVPFTPHVLLSIAGVVKSTRYEVPHVVSFGFI